MSRAWVTVKLEVDGGNCSFPEPMVLADKLRAVLLDAEIDWPDYPIDSQGVIDTVAVEVGEVDQEPRDAGRDPYGRPDPRTHPEYWTE